MVDRQAWDLAFDPATGRRRTQRDVGNDHLLPSSRWPSFFSRVVARLQWDAKAIELAPDARARPELPDERRQRLTALLAGFRVSEAAGAWGDAVPGQIRDAMAPMCRHRLSVAKLLATCAAAA